MLTKYRIITEKGINCLEYYYEGRFMLFFAWNRWRSVPTVKNYNSSSWDIRKEWYVHGYECRTIPKEFPDISVYIAKIKKDANRQIQIKRDDKKRKITYL